MALIALHVAAALFHALVLRDGLMPRMFFGRRVTRAIVSARRNRPEAETL
jgi:cytochrome b561